MATVGAARDAERELRRSDGRNYEHLLRDRAMNPRDIERLLDEWEALGFVPTETVGGVLRFRDVCAVETLLGGARLPCDWLEVDWERRAGFLMLRACMHSSDSRASWELLARIFVRECCIHAARSGCQVLIGRRQSIPSSNIDS
ncbi:MAG: hypothetical protein ABI349_07760 [Casimicrobiaceae bacterium]